MAAAAAAAVGGGGGNFRGFSSRNRRKSSSASRASASDRRERTLNPSRSPSLNFEFRSTILRWYRKKRSGNRYFFMLLTVFKRILLFFEPLLQYCYRNRIIRKIGMMALFLRTEQLSNLNRKL